MSFEYELVLRETTTKTESRTRFFTRFGQGHSCVTTTATGSLSRFKRTNPRRLSVALRPSTRGRSVSVSEDAQHFVDCLHAGSPGSAEGGFLELRPPTEKDLDKSGLFELRRVMSRGSWSLPGPVSANPLSSAPPLSASAPASSSELGSERPRLRQAYI